MTKDHQPTACKNREHANPCNKKENCEECGKSTCSANYAYHVCVKSHADHKATLEKVNNAILVLCALWNNNRMDRDKRLEILLKKTDEITQMFESLLKENEEKDRRIAELTEVLESLPEKLRSQMDGHKGQAHRIALQVTNEALSPTSKEKCNQ